MKYTDCHLQENWEKTNLISSKKTTPEKHLFFRVKRVHNMYKPQICFFLSLVLPVMMNMGIAWKAKLKIFAFAIPDGKVIVAMTAVPIGIVRKQMAQSLVFCQMNAGAPTLPRHLTPQACVTFLHLSRHHRLNR
jgi:hypothetical protein